MNDNKMKIVFSLFYDKLLLINFNINYVFFSK